MRSSEDLERFVNAQDAVYAEVLNELKAGRKESHWMWFIFPQLRGLGRSPTASYFGVVSAAEAAAYLEHPILGPRLRACVELVLAVKGRTAHQIFGSPDDLKFRSSMTLFASVASSGEALFQTTLDRFFGGERDPLTIAALRSNN